MEEVYLLLDENNNITQFVPYYMTGSIMINTTSPVKNMSVCQYYDRNLNWADGRWRWKYDAKTSSIIENPERDLDTEKKQLIEFINTTETFVRTDRFSYNGKYYKMAIANQMDMNWTMNAITASMILGTKLPVDTVTWRADDETEVSLNTSDFCKFFMRALMHITSTVYIARQFIDKVNKCTTFAELDATKADLISAGDWSKLQESYIQTIPGQT